VLRILFFVDSFVKTGLSIPSDVILLLYSVLIILILIIGYLKIFFGLFRHKNTEKKHAGKHARRNR
jgi:hypothetical protein